LAKSGPGRFKKAPENYVLGAVIGGDASWKSRPFAQNNGAKGRRTRLCIAGKKIKAWSNRPP
jgi:hypothetical protein